MKLEKAIFESDILRRDKDDLTNRNKQMQFDLNKALQRLSILETSVVDKDEQLKEQYDALLNQERTLHEFGQHEEKLLRQLEFEKDCREQDSSHYQAEVKDLHEQITEYEEETMSLQNQIYQLKLQATEKDKNPPSPTKSVISGKTPQKSPNKQKNLE